MAKNTWLPKTRVSYPVPEDDFGVDGVGDAPERPHQAGGRQKRLDLLKQSLKQKKTWINKSSQLKTKSEKGLISPTRFKQSLKQKEH